MSRDFEYESMKFFNMSLLKCVEKPFCLPPNLPPIDSTNDPPPLFQLCLENLRRVDDPLKITEELGVTKTKRMYEHAIMEAAGEKAFDLAKLLSLKYIVVLKSLQDWRGVRSIYRYASCYADLRSDFDFWNQWLEFEKLRGFPDSFDQMDDAKLAADICHHRNDIHRIMLKYVPNQNP